MSNLAIREIAYRVSRMYGLPEIPTRIASSTDKGWIWETIDRSGFKAKQLFETASRPNGADLSDIRSIRGSGILPRFF